MDRICLECKRILGRERRKRNPEQAAAWAAVSRTRHAKRIAEYKARWRKAKREADPDYAKKHYQKTKAAQLKWRAKVASGEHVPKPMGPRSAPDSHHTATSTQQSDIA